MRTIINTVVAAILWISCSENSQTTVPDKTRMRTDTVGGIVYNVSDSNSRLIISYHECTECLDAYVDSGNVYLSDSLMQKIKSLYAERGAGFLPQANDLYLTGANNIAEILFGDSTSYGALWHHKYEVTGKVIGIKGLGVVFRVDTYKQIEN